jgi:hypothetical protein
MSRDDGGSAFPVRSRWDSGLEDGGMSLRDYFAAHSIDAALRIEELLHGKPLFMLKVASRAYKLADAMLTAREKEW